MPDYKQNPIGQLFRTAGKTACAAGRLVNEWRDTLGYGAGFVILTVAAVDDWLAHGFPHAAMHSLDTIDQLCIFTVSREAVRGLVWFGDSSLQFAGPRLRPRNTKALACSATMTASVMATAQSAARICLGHPAEYLGVLVGLAAAGYMAHVINGPRQAIRNYREILWDYPRKNQDGGGTTQTQKFIAGAKKIGGKIAGAILPPVAGPAHGLVPIRVKREPSLPPARLFADNQPSL